VLYLQEQRISAARPPALWRGSGTICTRFEFVETLSTEQRAAGSFTPELIGIIKNAALDDLDELRKQTEHDMRWK
jgi:hypothetical protein